MYRIWWHCPSYQNNNGFQSGLTSWTWIEYNCVWCSCHCWHDWVAPNPIGGSTTSWQVYSTDNSWWNGVSINCRSNKTSKPGDDDGHGNDHGNDHHHWTTDQYEDSFWFLVWCIEEHGKISTCAWSIGIRDGWQWSLGWPGILHWDTSGTCWISTKRNVTTRKDDIRDERKRLCESRGACVWKGSKCGNQQLVSTWSVTCFVSFSGNR